MTPDNGKHIIICRSYGDLRAYACTLDNARAIFDNHVADLPREIEEVASQLADTERPSALYGAQGMQDALSEVLTKKPDDESSKLRAVLHGPARRNEPDTRPTVLITEAAQQELVLWLFKHGLSAKPLDSSIANKFNDLHPELELAFLAPFVQRIGKPIQYIRYPEYLEAAKSLKSLRANRWKDDAQEDRVVEQYLRFVREWLVDTSDTTYEVSELAASFT
jgi:hypothetical protein